MKKLLVWGVVAALLATIGYSVVLANREKTPEGLTPASLCRVTSYSLAATGGSVSAVVVCGESGRYTVSTAVSGAGDIATGEVTVKLSKDLPSMVTIGFSPAFPKETESYQVQFLVEKA